MMQQRNMLQVLIQLLIIYSTEDFAFTCLVWLRGGIDESVPAETLNGLIVVGEHIELCVGVVEHLLIAGTVAAETGAVAGELPARDN